MKKNKLVSLIILDGWGIAKPGKGNAISQANIPNFKNLLKKYPNATLKASGLDVGLPDGQMGNSEVGHLNLGAGRIVYQSLTRINKTIEDKSFYKNKAYLNAIKHVKKHNSKLHIMGLFSDGGVHSHINHIIEICKMAEKNGLKDKTFLHAILDGRDTPTDSGLGYVDLYNKKTNVKIASVIGRYYTMDRDNNWDRIQIGYDLMTKGIGEKFNCAKEAIKSSYKENITDEFVKPKIIDENGLVKSNDAIIFMNFRQDRAIRIATAFSNPSSVSKYYTKGKPTFTKLNDLKNIFFVQTMHYADTVKGEIAFPKEQLKNIYGDVISKNNMKQLRIAETEKYAHVTFFFDGGQDKEIKGAKRVLINSPKVKTYDLKPEMSAYEVKDNAVKELKTGKYNTMILNFANPDMVGHTGVIPAAIKACEAVDKCLGEVLEEINNQNGVAIILADHGNCEYMLSESGEVVTSHTTNLVPIIVTDENLKVKDGGRLSDIAPTMLYLLGIDIPKEMTGKVLVK